MVLLGKFIKCPGTVEVVVENVPPLVPPPLPVIVLQPNLPLLYVSALTPELHVESPAPKRLVVKRFVVEARDAKKFVVVALVVVELVLVMLVLLRLVIVDEALMTSPAT